jgi:hypothetical protein
MTDALAPGAPQPAPIVEPIVADVYAHALDVKRPADGRTLAVAFAVGVVFDVAVHHELASVAGVLLAAGVGAGLFVSRRLVTVESKLLTIAAVALAVFAMIRSTDWLIALDVLTVAALFIFAASVAQPGALFDDALPRLVSRFVIATLHAFAAPAFVQPAVQGRRTRQAAPIVRGLLLALPIVLVLGALLASADAVFASFFHADVNAGVFVGHIVLVVVGAWLMAGLLRVASAEPVPAPPQWSRVLRRTEATVVLVAVDLLFAIWVAAQVYATTDAGHHVLSTRGLTYAEYARQGFFQLVGISVIVIALTLALRAALVDDGARTRRRFMLLAEPMLVSALAMVVVAVRRLSLYESVFGFTELRLVVHVVAVAIGVALVMLMLAVAGVGEPRRWFPTALALLMVAVVVGFNILNPSAWIARHNLDRTGSPVALDGDYLVGLDADAVPVVAARLPTLDPDTQARVRALLCSRPIASSAGLSWNRARARARAALATVDCRGVSVDTTTSYRSDNPELP